MRFGSIFSNIFYATMGVIQPGDIDALTTEMSYLVVSVNYGCQYCINSHTAAARK